MSKSKLLLPLFSLCILLSCKEKQKPNNLFSQPDINEYYQKETPYDGWKGKIDSVVAFTFIPDIGKQNIAKGALKTKNTKVFNEEGYLVSFMSLEYENSELSRASQVLYTRNDNNLQSNYLSNQITKTGEGHTLQYTLRDRNLNKEIREFVRKLPGRDIELAAEIREYTKDGLKILIQVENNDSVTLVLDSKYNNQKLIENTLYEDGKMKSKAIFSYNVDSFISIISTTDMRNISNIGRTKKIEYTYDSKGNPQEASVFEDDVLTEIVENKTYYRKDE